jgi:hypothetical protein
MAEPLAAGLKTPAQIKWWVEESRVSRRLADWLVRQWMENRSRGCTISSAKAASEGLGLRAITRHFITR